MASTRCLAVLALALFLGGCSDARTNPRQRSKTRSQHAIAVAAKSPGQDTVEALPPGRQVVQAAYAEVEKAPSPAETAPSLLDQAAVAESSDDQHPAHQEANEILIAAVKALRTKLAVISHNMANADTVAFKRSRVALEDFGYHQVKLPGAQDAFNNYAPVSIAVGHGCRVQAVEVDFSQGEFDQTNNPLDLAINGHGFFQVIDPTTNNFLYTRSGNFTINSNGILVIGSASTGRVVQPQISIPIDTTGIVISAEGNVSIQQFGQTQFSQVGQLQMAKFLNPEGLLKLGENLYEETLASGAAIFGQPGTNGLGTLQQNMLERSNVDLDEELLEWQTTERTLKCFQRLLGAPTR
jgi:flagellar basal-body rod protein FlgG